MNVQIRHNGVNITSRVIQYSREHNICTSIGRLQVTIEGTYSTTIEPHDTIDIYEEGDFKVKYYVSQVSEIQPEGTIVLECQDRSKYIVDYFIPDTYTIDYPSYTRYWIEKFLTEAQVPYQFTVSSQGNLISNNTALGLQPAYDQIMMLLQLSGWFMYFDGNGVAVIGTLTTELADPAGSINNTDILDIKRISDDKMLRNRAVVWGQYDPIGREYAYADVTRHTAWDYDHNDLRSMVISNQNIPNKSSAYNIANILLKEFARITVQKHITVHGARDWNLGEALRVNSNVWRGTGLITTFGVNMDRGGGLVTNVILDERCPRLFGFFDFGDYVYIGTFGDGVWRKHIKFDPTWYNFSTGLLDLNITDLHINNGIFGSVGHSGGAFYANSESGPWNLATITGLQSSVEDTVPSGQAVAYTMFSGLMARATIVDKELNTVKYGIDTWSGLNTGDYFLTSSGIAASGTMSSGEMRSWIVEVDPYTGEIVGGLGSGIYPVSYSGDYSYAVLDLENDGKNDYISVRGTGESIPNDGTNWNFGQRTNQPFASTRDYDTYSVAPSLASYVNNSESINLGSKNTFNSNSLVAMDNAVNGIRKMVVFGKDLRMRLSYLTLSGTFTQTSTTSPVHSVITTSNVILAIYPDWFLDQYTVFYKNVNVSTNDSFWYTIWTVSTNTWSAPVLIGTQAMVARYGVAATRTESVTINNKCYVLRYTTSSPATVGGFRLQPSYLDVYIDTIDIEFRTFSEFHLMEFITEDDDLDGRYDNFVGPTASTVEALGTFNRTIFGIFQKDNGIQILGWTTVRRQSTPLRYREYVFVGDNTTLQTGLIHEDVNLRFTTGTSNLRSQLTLDKAFIGRQSGTVGQGTFSFTGTTFTTEVSAGTLPRFKDPSKIYPILNHSNRYIILNSGTFYLCDAEAVAELSTITPPTGYVLSKPFSTPVRFVEDEIYFAGFTFPDFTPSYIPYNVQFFSFNTLDVLQPNQVLTSAFRGVNFGGFFIAEPADYTVASPLSIVHYVDMGTPEYGGGTFLVLQREGLDFNLIQESTKPIRVDISNNSPLLTVLDNENTFISNFVYENELTQIIPISGLDSTKQVRDYRYTMLETVSGVVVGDGAAASMQAIYVANSGVYTSSVDTYSGGFLPFGTSPSGLLERIETTNYTSPGQFIFVTTSGDDPTFYQKDNDSLIFDTYDGIPDSRVTIIRCDDRM
jgi:hypothetical protein